MNKLWTIHLKPKNDELLSSWLVRLAVAHGLKVHTLCSITFPNKAIWNRDIDKSADSEIIRLISQKTGVSFVRAYQTTLASFEGFLFENQKQFGLSLSVIPVGVYHRKRTQFGLQYCAQCLAEDETPYFRRKWRLTFMTFCEEHHTLLHDRCPYCGSAINFHRGELGDFHKPVAKSLINCYVCDFDLRKTEPVRSSPIITSSEIDFTNKLLRGLKTGYIKINEDEVVYSHLYFAVLYQFMKIGTMKSKSVDKLRKIVERECNIVIDLSSNVSVDLPQRSITNRKNLFTFAHYLLSNWFYRFVHLSQKCGVWSSIWLKNMDGSPWDRSKIAPYWFWKIVREYLYKPKYKPSDEEIKLASKYLINNGINPSIVNVSEALGAVYIRRFYRKNKNQKF